MIEIVEERQVGKKIHSLKFILYMQSLYCTNFRTNLTGTFNTHIKVYTKSVLKVLH